MGHSTRHAEKQKRRANRTAKGRGKGKDNEAVTRGATGPEDYAMTGTFEATAVVATGAGGAGVGSPAGADEFAMVDIDLGSPNVPIGGPFAMVQKGGVSRP